MGVKRVIDTDFWKDDMVAERYSAEDRYFFLYLLTNPNSKQCGIYHLPLRVIAFEMGHSRDSVESIVDRFEHRFKNIIYNKETQEIAILNFLKHSIVKGGKPVEDCIRKELEKVKDKSLIVAVYKHMLPYMNEQIKAKENKEKPEKSMYIGIKEVFRSFINENEIDNDNEKENDNDNDNDNDNESIVPRFVPRIVDNEIPYTEIIDYLNLKANTNYRSSTKKTRDLIKARFNDGFNLDDFKAVIDKKTMDWLNDPKMATYLRPETLFGTKFESYLNQPTKQNKKITTKDLDIDISDFYSGM